VHHSTQNKSLNLLEAVPGPNATAFTAYSAYFFNYFNLVLQMILVRLRFAIFIFMTASSKLFSTT
jgi:hypothetical protein